MVPLTEMGRSREKAVWGREKLRVLVLAILICTCLPDIHVEMLAGLDCWGKLNVGGRLESVS